MYCPNCGKQIPDRAKFCSKCGGRVVPMGTANDTADDTVAPPVFHETAMPQGERPYTDSAMPQEEWPYADPVMPYPEEAYAVPKKSGKKKILIGVLAAAAAAAVCIVLIFFVFPAGPSYMKKTVFNYDGDELATKNEMEYDGGDMVLQTQSYYSDGTLSYENVFDQYGLLLKTVSYYNGENEQKYDYTYTYDDKGNPVQAVCNEDGSDQQIVVVFTSDENNRVSRMVQVAVDPNGFITDGGFIKKYEYSPDGDYFISQYSGEGMLIETGFNAHDDMISQKIYNDTDVGYDQSFEEKAEENTLTLEDIKNTDFTFEKNGLMMEAGYSYDYDAKGNISHISLQTTYNGGDTDSMEIDLQNEYDPSGKIIFQQYEIDGNRCEITYEYEKPVENNSVTKENSVSG